MSRLIELANFGAMLVGVAILLFLIVQLACEVRQLRAAFREYLRTLSGGKK